MILNLRMGRKPNQLILEHFDRGVRLSDNSNRYEQRCKACGEHFPKGRVETLVAHLEAKCPGITPEDRARVVAQVHRSPQPDTDLYRNRQRGPTEHGPAERQTVLPVTDRQNLTGLEALAEASRRLTNPANLAPICLIKINQSIQVWRERHLSPHLRLWTRVREETVRHNVQAVETRIAEICLHRRLR